MKKLVALIISTLLLAACAPKNPNGLFDGYADVGNPKLTGTFNYDASSDTYTLTGGGTNMWFGSDEFFMAYKKLSGDFSVSTKIAFEGKGVNPHRKVGVMLRESLDTSSKYADVAVHGDGLVSLQYRTAAGGDTKELVADGTGFDHVTITRSGNKIIMKLGHDGFSDVNAGEIELDFEGEVYAGIFICSHETDVIEKAYFTNVKF